MTQLSYEQAINWLDNNPNATLDQLRELVSNTDASTNIATLFYSNEVNGQQMWEMADNIKNTANGKVATVSDTDVDRLLNSQKFEISLFNSTSNYNASNPSNPITSNEVMNGTVDSDGVRSANGMWDIASKSFADSASGDVRTLSIFANADSVFVQTELPALLSNPNVTSIDGIPIDDLRAIESSLGFDVVLDKVKETSASHYSLLGFGYQGGELKVDSKKFFAINDGVDGSFLPVGVEVSTTGGIMLDADGRWDSFVSAIDSSKLLSVDTLNKMGLAGDVLGLLYVTSEASNAYYDENDPEKAADIMSEWAVGVAGGLAAGAVAVRLSSSAISAALSSAAVSGPVSPVAAVMVGALVFISGFAAAIYGDHESRELFRIAKDLGIFDADAEDKNLLFNEFLFESFGGLDVWKGYLEDSLQQSISDEQFESIILGTLGEDDIVSQGEGSVVYSSNDEDDIILSEGDDIVISGDEDDNIVSNLGRNIIDGGEGDDTVSYANMVSAVDVDLSAGIVTVGEDKDDYGVLKNQDTLFNVENIVATDFADDLLGSNAGNRLEGKGGKDVLEGGQGNDVLIGGVGDDTYVFSGLDSVSNLGRDIVVDEDGNGKLVIDGVEVDAVAKRVVNADTGVAIENSWLMRHNGVDYYLSRVDGFSRVDSAGGNLLITKTGEADSSNSVFVKDFNFESSAFGIVLSDAAASEVGIGDVSSSELRQDVVRLDNGQMISVYVKYAAGSSISEVYAQRLDEEGNKLGNEFAVTEFSSLSNISPSVVGVGGGDFMVAWGTNSRESDLDWRIYAQRFDQDNAKVGAGVAVSGFANDRRQINPEIASLEGGGYVIAWEDRFKPDEDDAYSHYTHFINAGIYNENGSLRTYIALDDKISLKEVVPTEGGGFIVRGFSDTAPEEFFARKYNADGQQVGNEWSILTDGKPYFDDRIDFADDGSYVIVSDEEVDDSHSNIIAKKYGVDNVLQSTTFVSSATSDVVYETPKLLSDGSIIIVWREQEGDVTSERKIFTKKYDAEFNVLLDKFQVNETTIPYNGPVHPNFKIIDLGAGAFSINWEANILHSSDNLTNDNVFVKSYDALGNAYANLDSVDPNLIPKILDNVTNVASNDLVLASNGDDKFDLSPTLGAEYNIADFKKSGGDVINLTSLTDDDVNLDVVQDGDDAKLTINGYDIDVNLKGFDASNLSYSDFLVNENFRNFEGDEGNNNIVGNLFDNQLTGNGGNDILEGKQGLDSYNFADINHMGQNKIIDSDGDGVINLEGSVLNSTAYKVKDENGDILDNSWVIEHNSKQYYLSRVNECKQKDANGLDLILIPMLSNDISNSIIIKDFDFEAGAFGINFDIPEFEVEDSQVNSSFNGQQVSPETISYDDGSFIVFWSSNHESGSTYDIFAQKYNADGSESGVEFKIEDSNGLLGVKFTSLDDGGFVLSSRKSDASNSGVFAQIYLADGSKVGNEFQVNTHTDSTQAIQVLTTLADGSFVVSWTSREQDGSHNGIFAQKFNVDGSKSGEEFQVNSYTDSSQSSSAITALNDGGFVISWTSREQDGSHNGIFAQRFDSNGNEVGNEFQINSYVENNQITSNIAALDDGGFVISWQSNNQDGSSYGIFAQKYNADGNKVGSEFQVNSYVENNQITSNIAALDDGGFVISWQSSNQDGSSYGIFAQKYNADGNKVGDELQINRYTNGNQYAPKAVTLENGGFAIIWQSANQDGDGNGIFAKMFDGNSNAITQDQIVEINSSDIPVISSSDFTIFGVDNGNVKEIIKGTVEDNVIIGGKGFDDLRGKLGSDTYVFNKGDGRDVIHDLGNNDVDVDVLKFGGGISKDDLMFRVYNNYLHITLKNSPGDKVIIAHQFTPNALKYRVERIEFSDNDDEIDLTKSFSDIKAFTPLENYTFRGSNDGEIVKADFHDNVIIGGKGFDDLRGKLGSDTYVFNKGDGRDVIHDLGNSDVDVDVLKFGAGISKDDLMFRVYNNYLHITLKNSPGDKVIIAHQFTPDALRYRVERVEFTDNADTIDLVDIIVGDNHNNNLIGDDNNNVIYGNSGDDNISGGLGLDNLIGGEGNDSFDFSSLEDSSIDAMDVIEDFEQGKDIIDLSQIEEELSFDSFEFTVENGHTVIKDKNSNFAINLQGELNINENDLGF